MLKYIQWLEADFGVVARGVLGLFVLVVSGVLLAETAVNDLTRHADFIQFINMQISRMGEYTFYFCGDNYKFNAVIEAAKLSKVGSKLVVETGGSSITIDTMPALDIRYILSLLAAWLHVLQQGIVNLLYDTGVWLLNMLLQLWMWLVGS